MVTQPQVEFRKHRGSSKLIIKIIDPREGVLVLYHGLVDRSVMLDQSVRAITLLDKERRCSPSRGTWTDEAFLEGRVDLLLQFKEVVTWHLIWALGNRDGAGLQVDDEFNFPNRGYPRQFFWEYVGKITNDWDFLNPFERCDIQGIQSIYTSFGIHRHNGSVTHNRARRMKKLDDLGATIKCGIVGFQPIHAKDKVDGGGFQNVWRNHELKFFDLDG